MVKLAMIVYMSDSGLGNQTKNLANFLKPDRLLIIDSSSFSKNKTQHPDWYRGFKDQRIVQGFPKIKDVEWLLEGMTHVFCCEDPYNYALYSEARRLGVKSICQVNFEFNKNVVDASLPAPDVFLMPSNWMYQEMKSHFKATQVEILPPPLDLSLFDENRQTNLNRSGRRRFLHIVGTLASNDRNGTLSLLSSLRLSNKDYELVITSQHELPDYYFSHDSRVTYRIGTEPNYLDLYKDFDALILPRRYGGLCLPMNEALASGLLVLMTDRMPNNLILPQEWLIKSVKHGFLKANVDLTLYHPAHSQLAMKLDWLATIDHKSLLNEKNIALKLASDSFGWKNLKDRYDNILGR